METRRQQAVGADQLIVDNMHLGRLIYQLEREEDDRSLRVTRINPSAARLTGWSEDEALGQYVDEIFRRFANRGCRPCSPRATAPAHRRGHPFHGLTQRSCP